MERSRRVDSEESDSRSDSGVRRALGSQLATRIKLELEAASKRVAALRSGVALQREAQGTGDDDLSWRALQEIDVAHEELHVLEEELHAQADEWIATRERLDRDRRVYAELFEAAPDAYLVTDDQGTIIQVNRRAASLFERSAASLIGKPLAALVMVEDRGAIRDLIATMNDAVFLTELRTQPRNDASRRWISISAQRGVRDERSICIRWQIRDITLEKADEALRVAGEELLRSRVRELEASYAELGGLLEREQMRCREADERARTKANVLAEVAHELRTPLSAAAGWLHLLHEQSVPEAIKDRAIISMIRSIGGLARMVDELLEHARVANHQITLKLEPVNLTRLVVDVLEEMQPLARLKGVEFDLTANDPMIEVTGDSFRLQQVLRNLFGNAIKFTPEGGAVRVYVTVSNLQTEITVTDTGRGIPRDALSRIFAPFVRVGDDKRHTGLGLGLSIAKRLIEMHGGSITAESEGPQRGTTLRVRLPLGPIN